VALVRPAIVALALAALATGAHSQEDVPFITTPDRVTLAMLRLADVRARDFVLDLGSGDGRIVITAAKRFGARGLGVEIVPELIARSRANAQRAGVAARVEFREQDLFQTDLAVASVITMYLLPEVNLRLRPALLQLAPGTRIVSHDWDLGDWRPDRTLTLAAPEKTVGRDKLSRLHLWTVPAPLQGRWCARDAQLVVEQRYQQVSARIESADDARTLDGRVAGSWLQLSSGGELSEWRHVTGTPPRLELRRAGPALARWQGLAFAPAPAAGCPH
jgi:SAM-dependent methyltransferase